MPEIILTDEQSREFSQAREKVVLRDSAGNLIGEIDPFDAIALADHRRHLTQPRVPGIPSEKIDEWMKALEAEQLRLGGKMDREYTEAFLKQLGAVV